MSLIIALSGAALARQHHEIETEPGRISQFFDAAQAAARDFIKRRGRYYVDAERCAPRLRELSALLSQLLRHIPAQEGLACERPSCLVGDASGFYDKTLVDARVAALLRTIDGMIVNGELRAAEKAVDAIRSVPVEYSSYVAQGDLRVRKHDVDLKVVLALVSIERARADMQASCGKP